MKVGAGLIPLLGGLQREMSKIFNMENAKRVDTPGVSTMRWLLDREVGATKMMAALYDYEPNLRMERLHYHVSRESAYLVLEGEARIHLNGEEHKLGPETVVYISPGDVHAVVGTGVEGLKLLEVWSPAERDIVYLDERPK